MVFQQRLQVLFSVLAEQESIRPRSQLLEGEIGWGEEGPALVVGVTAVQFLEKSGLGQGEF